MRLRPVDEAARKNASDQVDSLGLLVRAADVNIRSWLTVASPKFRNVAPGPIRATLSGVGPGLYDMNRSFVKGT